MRQRSSMRFIGKEKMKVRETYRYFLKNGMKSMLEVSEHLLACIGIGWDWADGELCPDHKLDDWYKGPKVIEIEENLCDTLKAKWTLENEVAQIKRKFVLDNIERILDSPIDSHLFQSTDISYGHYVLRPCKYYANAIRFPDNITKEWAEVVYKFNCYWMTNFRKIHGVGSKGEINFWPKESHDAYLMIEEAKKRAFKIWTGQSYDEYMEEMNKHVEEIISRNEKESSKS